MRKNKFSKLCIPVLLLCATASAERLVDDLLAGYAKIETVSCEVRRTTEVDGSKTRALTRVQYARPDRINVHSRAPIKRRHVADGERLYYYVECDPKGFSRVAVSAFEPPATTMKARIFTGASGACSFPMWESCLLSGMVSMAPAVSRLPSWLRSTEASTIDSALNSEDGKRPRNAGPFFCGLMG
jgi:hypothetical protein